MQNGDGGPRNAVPSRDFAASNQHEVRSPRAGGIRGGRGTDQRPRLAPNQDPHATGIRTRIDNGLRRRIERAKHGA